MQNNPDAPVREHDSDPHSKKSCFAFVLEISE